MLYGNFIFDFNPSRHTQRTDKKHIRNKTISHTVRRIYHFVEYITMILCDVFGYYYFFFAVCMYLFPLLLPLPLLPPSLLLFSLSPRSFYIRGDGGWSFEMKRWGARKDYRLIRLQTQVVDVCSSIMSWTTQLQLPSDTPEFR